MALKKHSREKGVICDVSRDGEYEYIDDWKKFEEKNFYWKFYFTASRTWKA